MKTFFKSTMIVVSSALMLLFSGCAKDYDDSIKNLEQTISSMKSELLQKIDDQDRALEIAYKLADIQVEKNALAAAKEEVAALKKWVEEQLPNYVTQTQFSTFKEAYNTKVNELTNDISLINQSIAILPTLTGDVNTLKAQMAVAQNNIEDAKTAITSINNSLTTINGDINQLSNELTVSNNNIANLGRDIDGIRNDITGLGNDIASINGWITNANAWMSTTDNAITNMSRDISNNTNDINTINGTLTSINGTISTINGTLGTMGNDITNVQRDISAANTDIAALKVYNEQLTIWRGTVMTGTEVSTLIAESEARTGDKITANEIAIGTLRNDYTTLLGMYGTLESQMSAAISAAALLESRVSAVERDVTNAKSDILALQATLGDALYDIILLGARLDRVEGDVTTAKSDILTLQTTIGNAAGGLVKDVADLSNGLSSLESTVNSLGLTINGLETRIITLESTVTNLGSRLTTAEGNISELMARIQSIVYVPRYDDGKATLEITDNLGSLGSIDTEIVLDFLISPTTAADNIVAAYIADPAAFKIIVNEVMTRTISNAVVEINIADITTVPGSGIITVTTEATFNDYTTFISVFTPYVTTQTKAFQVALGLTSTTGKDVKISQFVGVYVKVN